MEPIKNITQKEISEVIDNPVDKAGNKIKLRSISHENLVRHLKNIPYSTEKAPQIETSKVNSQQEAKDWSLTPKQYIESIALGRKPINVKETMLNNIRKHSEMAETIEKTETEIKPEIEVTEVNITPEVEVSESIQPEVGEVQEAEVTDDNSVVNTNIDDSEINMEKAYEEINNIRQQISSKKEEAENAQQEAEKSDREVQELEVKYTEVQKQLQEAKIKNQEMKLKLLTALKSQTEILNNQTKRYNDLIEEANKRKEANMNVTREIQPKINSTQDETLNINNDTARIEEYLNALSSNNIIDFQDANEEEKVRKIA